jgi:hypothetical protein
MVIGILAASCAFAADPWAPSAHIPPLAKSTLDATLYPIPQAQVAEYLTQLAGARTYWTFAGKTLDLKAAAAADPNKMLTIGEGLAVDLGPEALFQAPFTDGNYQVFLGAVTSVDARELRLQVDLSALADDEELWLIDPVGQRPFGPYSRADHIAEGRWLPTVEGDTAVIMVRSQRTDLPQVRVVMLSHFFIGVEELKELSCNVSVACETNADVQEVSSGVGMMVVPTSGGDSALCSGTLINNPDTVDFEPYYITANHCVPGVATAAQVDIIWDFRRASCGSTSTPSLSSLPRSSGQSILATSDTFDCTLMQLDGVPVGTYGRTYVGWDASLPLIGDDCVVLHHPDGAYMRISYADIIRTGTTTASLGYIGQTEVQYPIGVTEGGSSGSALLSVKNDYAIIGTLSNGPYHTCGVDRSENTDKFSSFRRFYFGTAARNYLEGSVVEPQCPSVEALKDNPKALASLRETRDKVLVTSPAGRLFVQAYYFSAPTLADWVRRSGEFRQAFGAVASATAQVAEYAFKK